MRNEIHLQYYGLAAAKPAQDFKPGEIMMWNFGHKSKVVEVKEASKAFVAIRQICSDGKEYTGRYKKTRLIAKGY